MIKLKKNFWFSIDFLEFSTITQTAKKSILLVCKYFDDGSTILNISKNKSAVKITLKSQSLFINEVASDDILESNIIFELDTKPKVQTTVV